ncbi:MAG TPA: N-acetylmuramoyl-L-alanine amidase [Solirubrobacterales bacterium]|nr:N-acetylmuramoyl-L-alanine amidase [Solirubrobacterales bacterium]
MHSAQRALLLAAVAAVALAFPAAAQARPAIEHDRLAYWPQRVESAREWSLFMHGTDRFRPRLIVEHWTEGDRRYQAVNFWNSGPDRPWAHFLIDRRGRVTQFASLTTLARQAMGVSPWAIGIEHVGRSDGEVMTNPAMRRASYELTCWLRRRLDIPTRGVIGHAEITSHPRFHLTPAGWEWIHSTGHTFHPDFSRPTMQRYRERLRTVC